MAGTPTHELHRLAKHAGPADGCQACADAEEASRKWNRALRRHRQAAAKRIRTYRSDQLGTVTIPEDE